MTTLEAAAEAMPDRRIAWADFDAMLDHMAHKLGCIAEFFGFAFDVEQLGAIAEGPLMHRYSKDPKHEYSARLRRDLIAQEMEIQGREIEAALAMLRASAERHELIARALARAGES
jgi:hypothetical protein